MADPATHDEQALLLAREIVDDLELGRIPLDKAVYKAQRLARIVDDPGLGEFALYEAIGYPTDREVQFFSMTHRSSVKPPFHGSCAMLLSITGMVEGRQKALETMAAAGQASVIERMAALESAQNTSRELVMLHEVQQKIATLMHSFVSSHLYRLSFSNRQSSMFQQAQRNIDSLLAGLDERTLDKLDAAHERLRSGDAEAISHALMSCRRLIDQAADALFPATTETRMVGDNELKLGRQQVLNRLQAFVDDHTDSSSRRTRLRQTFRNLYERTSAGVHSSVTASEARYLYISVYIAIGELISMREMEPAVEVKVEGSD